MDPITGAQLPEPAKVPAASQPVSGGSGDGTPLPGAKSGSKAPPICIIMLGMAGSGKTTLLHRIKAHTFENGIPSYVVNLDPAVMNLPFGANIDIRDTVDYKEVMKQYKLGPNGGIMTSLNLFATRFDQVMGLLDKRAESLDFCLVDTPGQIEVFTWSASGTIITETLASTFPTVLVYVIDTPRTTNPITFMSNMLYACSILYKTRIPFIIAFNKIDVTSHEFAMEWMNDYEAFQAALDQHQGDESQAYLTGLTRSMSLVLDEFYNTLRAVGVSAATGDGMDEFFEAVTGAVKEYEDEYLPDLQARRAKQQKEAAGAGGAAGAAAATAAAGVGGGHEGGGGKGAEDDWSAGGGSTTSMPVINDPSVPGPGPSAAGAGTSAAGGAKGGASGDDAKKSKYGGMGMGNVKGMAAGRQALLQRKLGAKATLQRFDSGDHFSGQGIAAAAVGSSGKVEEGGARAGGQSVEERKEAEEQGAAAAAAAAKSGEGKYAGMTGGRQALLKKKLGQKPGLQRFDSGDHFKQREKEAPVSKNTQLPEQPPQPPS
jgi:GTPase SAR1 family protein